MRKKISVNSKSKTESTKSSILNYPCHVGHFGACFYFIKQLLHKVCFARLGHHTLNIKMMLRLVSAGGRGRVDTPLLFLELLFYKLKVLMTLCVQHR